MIRVILLTAFALIVAVTANDAEDKAKAIAATVKKVADFAYDGVGRLGENKDRKCKKFSFPCIGQNLNTPKCVDPKEPENRIGTNTLLSVITPYASGQGGGMLDKFCDNSQNRFMGTTTDRKEFETALTLLFEEIEKSLEKVDYGKWMLSLLRSDDETKRKMAAIARNKLDEKDKDKAKKMAEFIFKPAEFGKTTCKLVKKHCIEAQLTSLSCIATGEHKYPQHFPDDLKDIYLLNNLCAQFPGEKVCDRCNYDTILEEIKDDMVTQPKVKYNVDLFGQMLAFRSEQTVKEQELEILKAADEANKKKSPAKADKGSNNN